MPVTKTIEAAGEANTDTSPNTHLLASTKPVTPTWEKLTTHAVYNIVIRAGKMVGITHDCTPHLIRHWLGSDILNSCVPLEVVQEYLGHASPETTRTVYAHLRKNTLRKHVNSYFAQSMTGGNIQQQHLFQKHG